MITPNELPQIMITLLEKVNKISDQLNLLNLTTEERSEKIWLNVDDLQAYLPSHPKKQTIYSWTSTRRIPFHKKGRNFIFNKDEIEAWLQDGEHRKSIQELEQKANEFINNKNRNDKKI